MKGREEKKHVLTFLSSSSPISRRFPFLFPVFTSIPNTRLLGMTQDPRLGNFPCFDATATGSSAAQQRCRGCRRGRQSLRARCWAGAAARGCPHPAAVTPTRPFPARRAVALRCRQVSRTAALPCPCAPSASPRAPPRRAGPRRPSRPRKGATGCAGMRDPAEPAQPPARGGGKHLNRSPPPPPPRGGSPPRRESGSSSAAAEDPLRRAGCGLSCPAASSAGARALPGDGQARLRLRRGGTAPVRQRRRRGSGGSAPAVPTGPALARQREAERQQWRRGLGVAARRSAARPGRRSRRGSAAREGGPASGGLFISSLSLKFPA